MLSGIMGKGWEPIRDGENIIGLTQGSASVSLEPGGQFELSGGPMEDPRGSNSPPTCATCTEVARPLGLGFAGMGFHPVARREDMSWMPKNPLHVMQRLRARAATWAST